MDSFPPKSSSTSQSRDTEYITYLDFQNDLTNDRIAKLNELVWNDDDDLETGIFANDAEQDTYKIFGDDLDDYDRINSNYQYSSVGPTSRRRSNREAKLLSDEENDSVARTNHKVICNTNESNDHCIDNGYERQSDGNEFIRHQQNKPQHEILLKKSVILTTRVSDRNSYMFSSWQPLSSSFILPIIQYSSDFVVNNILWTGRKQGNLHFAEIAREKEPPSSNDVQEHSINFRTIKPKDRIIIQRLHEQWFPVRYHDEFYDDLVYNRFHNSQEPLYTCIATTTTSRNLPNEYYSESNSISSDDNCHRHYQQNSLEASQNTTCEMIIANHTQVDENDTNEWRSHHLNNKVNNTTDDDEVIIACVVGSLFQKNQVSVNTRELLFPNNNDNNATSKKYRSLFYIMTLGTCAEYRNLGLGTILVEKCIQYAETIYKDHCGVIYLHVIVTNTAAIRFYEKLGFDRITEIQNYYTINDSYYNCYLYAKYINGYAGRRSKFQALIKDMFHHVWNNVVSVWSPVQYIACNATFNNYYNRDSTFLSSQPNHNTNIHTTYQNRNHRENTGPSYGF